MNDTQPKDSLDTPKDDDRVPGSMWDRLPREIKEEFIEKERRDSERSLAFRSKLKIHRRNATLAGLIASAFIGFLMAGSPWVAALTGVCGAAAAYAIARNRWGHLHGMALFGGSNILIAIIAVDLGLVPADMSLPAAVRFFCSWVLFATAGTLIAIMVELDDIHH